MKVLILARNFPNILKQTRGTFVLSQLVALRKSFITKYSFDVISPVSCFLEILKRYQGKVPRTDIILEIPVKHPRWFFFPHNILKILYPYTLTPVVLKTIEKYSLNFDIVHSHFCYPDGVVGFEIARRFNKPLIITVHTGSIHILVKKFYWRFHTKKAFSYAAKVVAVSPRIKSELVGAGIPEEKIIVVPNIISGVFIDYQRHIKKNDMIKLISVGNLVWLKGFDFLIRAIKIISAKNVNIELTIVGVGGLLDELRKLADDLGIGHKVKFPGAILNSRLPEILDQHDIFVSSSIIESFGVSIFEALAVGLPVVITRSGGPEQFLNSSHGVIVDHSDEFALADGILKVINEFNTYDPKMFKDFVSTNFSEKSVAEALNEIYQSSVL